MARETLAAKLAATSLGATTGRVVAVRGVSLRFTLPGVRLGDVVTIKRRGEPLLAEVVGFEGGEALAVAHGDLQGIGPDDPVERGDGLKHVSFGDHLIGRVLDSRGRALDGHPLSEGPCDVPIQRPPPAPLERASVEEVLVTGVRAIDGLFTLGRGQRIGLFAGAGAGKSELIAQLARSAEADVVVAALVGERGREVRDFIERGLGEAGLRRSIVVAATSDTPPLERLRAAETATALAEGFRDAGRHVLLLVDSVTRLARAQREVGLASGEPPGRRGYPPSVFALLPRLLERPGATPAGSISAVYTVLTEGETLDDPIAEEVRSLLDGHLLLARHLTERGHFPAIDLAASISRLMTHLASETHIRAATELRRWWAAREEKRDLIALGAYQRGSDAAVDAALARWGRIEHFLRQDRNDTTSFQNTVAALCQLTEP